jgi:hypothetical protein
MAGDPAGHVAQVPADGGRAGGGVAACGHGGGGAGEVVRDRGQGEPGVVGVEDAGGQVGQGAVDEFGEDLFDDGVAAVLLLGLDGDERAVGERGVVAPDREQLTCPMVVLFS